MTMIIAGERSGAGKTTVTLAVLATLRQRQQVVQSFKVGPDYIDPMFHHRVTGRACRNLDPVLTSEAYVRGCFSRHLAGATYALIEGVMGLFDGATGADDFASTAHISRLLDVPVLLTLNCSSLARSIAAIVHGYCSFDPRVQVAGLVLNRVGSDRHLELLKSALRPLNIPILGVLPRQDEITIPDRHLGLVPSGELTNINPILDQLAHLGETRFDWDRLLPLLNCQTEQDRHPDCYSSKQGQDSPVAVQFSALEPIAESPPDQTASLQTALLEGGRLPARPKIRIAVACDAAFNFYYADNLDLLEQQAEVIYWSPLTDAVPEAVQGFYFGGGFPEVFAAELAQNQRACQAVQTAIQAGIPTYAECGGLMYLSEQIVDFSGRAHPMVGVLPTQAIMGKRLTLGYRQISALRSSPLVKPGDQLWGHEFHRSTITHSPDQPLFALQGYDSDLVLKPEGWQLHNIHASYVHVHFGAQLKYLNRFIQRCAQFVPASQS